MPDRPFYITTPIYYVNDRPHIGHCYTTVVADVAARFQRLVRGGPGPGVPPEVFFLTGTDEHADKVVVSAREHGVGPQEWADRNAAEFRRAFEFMGVAHDDFIRTTEARHKNRVVEYIAALMKSGDIYRGEYTGWYDPGQEEYVTENTARESGYKSPISGKPLVKRTEPCYFFRLGRYWGPLRAHIEAHPEFVEPAARRAEVLGRLTNEEPRDVPVSRPVTDDPATRWGIRVPGDEAHRVYVWIDALFNYLTVVDTDERRRLWPATVHLIGKDILWFHAVIWPALLMALKASDAAYGWVDLPRTVFGHGWWIAEGQKMSKSLGNFIDLEQLRAYAQWQPKGHARPIGVDALRWFLATQGPLSGADADFSHARFVEAYNADLANGIGNCASRVGNMIGKYFDGGLPPAAGAVPSPGASPPSVDWPGTTARAVAAASAAADRFDLNLALAGAVQIITAVDGYINQTEPFKVAKRLDAEPALRPVLAQILCDCAEAIRIASLLFYPAMPTKMAELWRRWNCSPLRDPADPNSGFVAPLAELARWGGEHSLKPGTRIEKGDALFMRIAPDEPTPGHSIPS